MKLIEKIIRNRMCKKSWGKQLLLNCAKEDNQGFLKKKMELNDVDLRL